MRKEALCLLCRRPKTTQKAEKMNNNAKFIVFEGIDGAGKSTQIRLLTKALTKRGIPVSQSAEPTIYPSGLKIREVLAGRLPATDDELAVMFASDRENHNTNPDGGINSLLENGITVISDRYYYSSLAYQGVQVGLSRVISLNLDNPNIRTPDLCIFLDLEPEQSLKRIELRHGQAEIFETYEYLDKTRKTFFKVIDLLRERGENIVCVDASRSPEEIADDVLSAVIRLF